MQIDFVLLSHLQDMVPNDAREFPIYAEGLQLEDDATSVSIVSIR